MCIGFLAPLQIFHSRSFVRIAFIPLACNLLSISLFGRFQVHIPAHIPGNRHTFFCFTVVFGIFPYTARHTVNTVADFLPIPIAAIFLPLVITVTDLRGTKILNRPVKILSISRLLFPLVCGSYYNFKGCLLAVHAVLAKCQKCILTFGNQRRKVCLFTGNAMFNFQRMTRFQMIPIPKGTKIFIFFQMNFTS